jgi:predicted MPP superfamily phosphohydrolase
MTRFFVILFFFLSYSIYKAIQLDPEQPTLMVLICVLLFGSVVGAMMASRRRPGSFESSWFKSLTWIGTTFIGFWGTFGLISIPIDLVDFVYSLFNDGHSFRTQNFHVAVLLVAVAMVCAGYLTVLFGPKVVEVDVEDTRLPDSFHNFRIAQISDLHIGPTVQTRYVKRVVEKTNALVPDLIVITGDLVDAHTESIKHHLQPLANLKAKHGVFYVTGNHEYYWGVKTLLPELEKLGLNILMNQNRVIEMGDSKLLLAGIPDPAGSHVFDLHNPDIAEARRTSDKTDYNILLAHRPDPYRWAEDHGFHLQFSGHTHAGQFFPFSLFIPLAHKYYRGLNRHGNLWLYVNSGTGYWGPANRFGVAPEITLAKLTNKTN